MGIGLGLGWGYIQHEESFALDWTTLQVHVTFFLLMRWEEGMEGYGRAGGVRTLFAGNREPTEICHCWPRGGFFFVFMRLVGSPTLPYLTFVVGTGS